MSVTGRVATVWRALRACSPTFASPATDVTDILEVGRVLPTISRTQKKRKSVCECKRCCATCGLLVTNARHECNKVFCANCKQKKDVGHLCFMITLYDVLPDVSYKVLYVFYDFEITPYTKYSDKATPHVSDLVCVQQLCLQCEDAKVRAMRSEEALVLGRSGRGHAKLSMQATPLGQ